MTDPMRGAPTTRPEFAPAHEDVISALEGWMVLQGLITPSTPKVDWSVSNYRDAYLVTAAQPPAANRTYLVHRGRVIGFDPGWTSFDAAYDTLMAPRSPSCLRRA